MAKLSNSIKMKVRPSYLIFSFFRENFCKFTQIDPVKLPGSMCIFSYSAYCISANMTWALELKVAFSTENIRIFVRSSNFGAKSQSANSKFCSLRRILFSEYLFTLFTDTEVILRKWALYEWEFNFSVGYYSCYSFVNEIIIFRYSIALISF